MSDSARSGYIRGENNQPVGPLQPRWKSSSLWLAGRLAAKTICWREGMTQWLPICRSNRLRQRLRRQVHIASIRGRHDRATQTIGMAWLGNRRRLAFAFRIDRERSLMLNLRELYRPGQSRRSRVAESPASLRRRQWRISAAPSRSSGGKVSSEESIRAFTPPGNGGEQQRKADKEA